MGDFNGDGKVDLAVANGDNTVTCCWGRDGTFKATSLSVESWGGGQTGVGVADFNGDGLADFAVAINGVGYANGTVAVLLSQLMQTATATVNNISPLGTGTHQVEASYPGAAASALAFPPQSD